MKLILMLIAIALGVVLALVAMGHPSAAIVALTLSTFAMLRVIRDLAPPGER